MKLNSSLIKMRMTVSVAALVAVIFVVTQVQTVQAQTTATLAYLADTPGATLNIGDKTFGGFSYNESGLTSFNASEIQVTASQVGSSYFLTWGGNISLVTGGEATADLLLNYSVTANDGEIFAIDQNYTGSAYPPGGAFISVQENAYAPGNVTPAASSYLNQNIDSTSYTAIGAILTPAQPILNVTKDIGLGVVDGGFITISQIEQSFEQVAVPEPATVGCLLLGLGVFACSRRFIRSRRS
jgi:PEP-CTERM motif-containing protein